MAPLPAIISNPSAGTSASREKYPAPPEPESYLFLTIRKVTRGLFFPKQYFSDPNSLIVQV
jgi:hypothetical protein